MSIGDEGAQNGFGQNPISADPRLPPLVTTFGWVSYRWAICFGTAYLGSSCIGFTLVCGPFNSCAWWWLVESVFHQHLWNSLVNHSYHPVNAYLSCVYAGVDSVKTGLTTVINTPPPLSLCSFFLYMLPCNAIYHSTHLDVNVARECEIVDSCRVVD